MDAMLEHQILCNPLYSYGCFEDHPMIYKKDLGINVASEVLSLCL